MTGDIVERLRRWVHSPNAVPVGDLLDEAAEVIESLRTEVRGPRADGYRSMPGRLRESAVLARATDVSQVLEEAASELDRLHIIIDCYAHSSAAACREINALRGKQ